MDNKVRKRKANNKSSSSKESHSKSKNILKNGSHTFSKVKFGLVAVVVLLSVLALAKLYSSQLAQEDNTLVPFDGNAFPSGGLLGPRYWSSLLSGHYFGLRASAPNSAIVSLMWFRNRVENNNLPIRHWCNQDDKLEKFFWNYNDLEFGHQSIQDRNLRINTSFIRHDGNGSITSRFSFVDSPKASGLNSVILYSAIESTDDTIEALNLHSFANNPVFTIKTQSKTSGNFTVHFKIIQGTPATRSFLTANSTLDQLKETVLKNLYIYRDPTNEKSSIFMISNPEHKLVEHKYNFVAYQIVFQKFIEIEAEMIFDDQPSQTSNRNFNFEHELDKRKAQFDRAFEEKFPLRKKNFSDEMITFARALLSNTMGGVSFFNGHSLVQSPHSSVAKPYGPLELLTAVPSRPFFPRGFLWDEGFHQLLISVWNPALSKTIIKSWFGLMNKDGWIPREVVLGDEAMARVPREFLVQYSSNANPPALFLAVESLLDSQQADKQWLSDIYPRFEAWFRWFNTTQVGQFPSTFRWRGRNATTNLELNPKTLASGFDDYPRATHPSDDEIHLDLRCWMALASRVMAKIAKALDIKNESYSDFYNLLRDNQLLERWHWSSQHKMFCDQGLNSEDVRLVVVHTGHGEEDQVVRQVRQPPRYGCVPNFGYVSLFPLIMNLLEPTNSKLETIMHQIEDPNQLWTPYGLRSISKSNFYYDKYNTRSDGPYWRGSIWVNVNFLVLKGLNYYATVDGPYQAKARDVYARLRENLIRNVFNEYNRTGFVWEHYSDKTGQGGGTYPMTGWTALIVKIMGERY